MLLPTVQHRYACDEERYVRTGIINPLRLPRFHAISTYFQTVLA
ncbi:hypothetical protein [Kosakonia sp. MUSA4]|nr:hypothetical protein [Kosakonia sp. MUSA4]